MELMVARRRGDLVLLQFSVGDEDLLWKRGSTYVWGLLIEQFSRRSLPQMIEKDGREAFPWIKDTTRSRNVEELVMD